MTTSTANKARRKRKELNRPWWFRLFITPIRKFLLPMRGNEDVMENIVADTVTTITQFLLTLITIQSIYVSFSALTIASHGYAVLPIFAGSNPLRLLPVGILSWLPTVLGNYGTIGEVLSFVLSHLPIVNVLIDGSSVTGSIFESVNTFTMFAVAYGAAAVWSQIQGALIRAESVEFLDKWIKRTANWKKIEPAKDATLPHRLLCRKRNNKGSWIAVGLYFGWFGSFIVELCALVYSAMSASTFAGFLTCFGIGVFVCAGFEVIEIFVRRPNVK